LRRRWRGILALVLVIAGASCERSVEHPNIVLLVGDDHGYPYAGFMGSPIVKTPNLDALAAGGVLFTTAYVTASTCEPSLRTLLTGEEPYPRTPATPGSTPGPPLESLPNLLGRAGYASFQAGKFWHKHFRGVGFTEGTKGDGLIGGPFEKMMGGRAGLAVGRKTMQPVYDFIDRHRDEPFFLFLTPNVPHRPWSPPPEHRVPYEPLKKELGGWTLGYYASITWLDDTIGELVAYLDEKQLRSRTLIVYLSDNGFRQEPGDPFDPKQIDHGKDSMGEIGFRTPLIFNWPGRIPAGVVRTDLVSSLDLFPTLLDFAGVPDPPARSGVDLRAAIEHGTKVPRNEVIGAVERVRPVSVDGAPGPRKDRAYFVRTPKWHYVQFPADGTQQLFDIETDPEERSDVATANPEAVSDLRRRIERWAAEKPPLGD
jgi:uncharacterized sulfatase